MLFTPSKGALTSSPLRGKIRYPMQSKKNEKRSLKIKIRKEFLLDEPTLQYITNYKAEGHFPSLTSALASIVDDHKHRNDIDTTDYVIKKIAAEVVEMLNSKLTRIRLGVNNADRNSDIIIMLLNTLLGYQEYDTLLTDDTPQLEKAKAIEKEKISSFRQKKIDREAKQKGRPSEVQPTFIIEDDSILSE